MPECLPIGCCVVSVWFARRQDRMHGSQSDWKEGLVYGPERDNPRSRSGSCWDCKAKEAVTRRLQLNLRYCFCSLAVHCLFLWRSSPIYLIFP